MENSVDATIEKIKIQEQMNEAMLKEKREYDVTVACLNRSVRENNTKAIKLKQEIEHMQIVTDKLQCQNAIEKCQKNALSKQVDNLFVELNQLRTKSHRKIASVWDLRADLIEATKHVTEICDIRTLLMKSTGIDVAFTLNTRRQQQSQTIMMNKHKLQTAVEKREEANNKRKKLLEQPENDDEFIR